MSQKTEKTVHMDAPFTYQLDPSRKRTLPVGWRGAVPVKLARQIEKEGRGRIVGGVPAKAQEPAETRAQLLERLSAALVQEDYTEAGSPEVAALNRDLPEGAQSFTADERDALWAELTAAKN